MKRYWLFLGEDYYPGGGMHDFIDSFSSVEDATAAAKSQIKASGGDYYTWWHVADSHTGERVAADSDDDGQDNTLDDNV